MVYLPIIRSIIADLGADSNRYSVKKLAENRRKFRHCLHKPVCLEIIGIVTEADPDSAGIQSSGTFVGKGCAMKSRPEGNAFPGK